MYTQDELTLICM